MSDQHLPPAIAAALVSLSTKLEAVGKSSTNPAFKSKYASLDAILASIKPSLADCGLAVLFRQVPQEDFSNVIVETLLIHESGCSISGFFAAPTQKKDAQGVGSCITYLKRYGISAILALETDDDDDGNSVSGTSVKVPAQVGSTQFPPRVTTPAPTKAATGRLDEI